MIPIGIYRYLVLLISLSTWMKLTDSKEMRVVCYYTNWSVYRPGQAKFSPQNINPYLCTHLIYAFGGFTKENTLKPFDKYQDIEKGGYAKFTGLKTYNKNLKTLIAIGGWNEGSSRFSPMVASADRRKELVRNAIKFLRQNHFDGLDLDWEYPSFRDGGKPRDRDNYAQLVKELREEFERESEKSGRPRLLLTMAVPAGIEYINKGYDVPKLTKYLDWMNILSYDYHSAFEPAVNHHAPLYSLEEDNEYNFDGELTIDYTIKHYLKLGADPEKLVLGIPTYGRSYTLFNPDSYELGSPADGPGDMGEATRENGYLAYYEICDNVKNQDWEVEEPNSKAMGPIAFKGNQWVGYDDENIVREKARYVADNDLGGIMFWAIDNDDFRGNCHGKPYPLIEAGREALINAYGLTDENLVSPPKKPTKTRTRPSKTTTTETPEDSSPSTAASRRRRIKNKNREEEKTSTYSSLKVVTPAYTTPAPPATPDMDGAFKCEEDGFFPHPKDCKKYFWCLSGPGDTGIVAHAFTCPAGLYFNKAADSCDYSQNVLCNKKLQKATTTTTSKPEQNEISFTESTTQRVRPKITAATSKTTIDFRRTTTTTVAPEEEFEYEDEDDEEKLIDKKIDLEEDPKVIKELIDLIRKAGGIEELEKQLKFGKGSASDTTTPPVISKSLYERVLSKANKNTSARKSPNNINSGGPQRAEAGEKTVERKTTQYQVLFRQRSTTEATIATEATNADREKRPAFRTKATLEYKKITRPKVNSASEDPNEESDQEENTESENQNTPRRNNIPQYVNIRRQRPSTTESTLNTEPASTDFDDEEDENDTRTNFIRRGSTTEASSVRERTSSRYQTIKRSTTPSSAIQTQDEESSRYQSIRRSTTPATASIAEDEDNSRKQTAASTPESKYIVLQRSTTSESPITDVETTSRYKAVLRESSQSTERPESTDSIDLMTDPYTEIVPPETTFSSNSFSSLTTETVPITTHNIETESKSSATFQAKPKRKPLLSSKPFATTSFSNPESTTEVFKVSQPSFRFRTRATTSSPSTSSTVRSRTRVRIANNNRNLSEDTEQQNKYERTVEKPTRTRKRIILSTEPSVDHNEESDRRYRPAELADLSSLTAVDLGIRGGEFVSQHRRRRPVSVTSATTVSSARDETIPRKNVRIFRSSTPKYSDELITTEISRSPSSTLRTRKIIRKFRPTPGLRSTTDASIEATPLKRMRVPFLRRTNIERVGTSDNPETRNEPLQEEDEDENINLSESNIRESSQINTFDFDEKPAKSPFRSFSINKSTSTTESNLGVEDEVENITDTLPSVTTSSYESTKLFRTRKIIRKFPTPQSRPTSESTTESNDSSKDRKVIRRLRPSFRYNKTSVDEKRPTDTVVSKPESSITKQSNFRRNYLFNQHKPKVDKDSNPEIEEEESEDEDREQDKIKKLTIFSSSVERKHQFESRTVFNDEDENDEDRIMKKNNSVVSHIIKSAENSREESTTVMDDMDDFDDSDDQITTEIVIDKTIDEDNDFEPTMPNLTTMTFEEMIGNNDEFSETTEFYPDTTLVSIDAEITTISDASGETTTVSKDDKRIVSDDSNDITTQNDQFISSTKDDLEVTPKYKRPSLLSRLQERKNEFRSRSTTSGLELSTTKTPIRTYGKLRKPQYIKNSSDNPRRVPSYRFRSTEKPVEVIEDELKVEDLDVSFDNEEVGDDKNVLISSSTPRSVNRYYGAGKETKSSISTDAEVIKNRNKNLFARRKMNSSAISTSSTSATPFPEDIKDEDTTATTVSNIQEDPTEPNLTTLHHVFAEIKNEDTSTESMPSSTKQSNGRLERLIEVNRIVEVKTKQGGTKVDITPTLDKIGEISRITYIKIVDGDNVTIIKDPELSKNVAATENIEEVEAQVNEIPSVNQNVKLADFKFNVNNQNEREDRKFNIFEGSKVANSKDQSILAKPEIIDGISHINVVTPKSFFAESSTIALQGLFQTERPRLNPSFTLNDELLESERSEFVNVRVLNEDGDKTEGRSFFDPIRIEDHTVKAHVMEIPARPDSKTIKIVPITVQMSRSLISPHFFKSNVKH